MLEYECALVEIFHWSLKDVDETDIESLLPFFDHYLKKKGASNQEKLIPGDLTDFA